MAQMNVPASPTEAVIAALIKLGEKAQPDAIIQAVYADAQIALEPTEVVAILETLQARSRIPPALDQPAPESCRGPEAERLAERK